MQRHELAHRGCKLRNAYKQKRHHLLMVHIWCRRRMCQPNKGTKNGNALLMQIRSVKTRFGLLFWTSNRFFQAFSYLATNAQRFVPVAPLYCVRSRNCSFVIATAAIFICTYACAAFDRYATDCCFLFSFDWMDGMIFTIGMHTNGHLIRCSRVQIKFPTIWKSNFRSKKGIPHGLIEEKST